MTNSSAPLDRLKGSSLHIGICDSGLGGLSILGPVSRALPAATFSYVADERFSPYGILDKETLIQRGVAITELLLKRDCDLIVVACNTLTAQAIDELRMRFEVPFVGVEPYVNALNKGLGPQARPAILCTVSTSQSARFQKLVAKCDPSGRSIIWPCPTLARQIECVYRLKLNDQNQVKLNLQGEKVILSLQEDLEALTREIITHAILGCTHYPLVHTEIEAYLSVPTLSPCAPVAHRVGDLSRLVYQGHHASASTYFFYSTTTEKWLQRPLTDAQQLG